MKKSNQEREKACHEWAHHRIQNHDTVKDVKVWIDSKTDYMVVNLHFRCVTPYIELTEISESIGKPFLVGIEKESNTIEVRVMPIFNF
jgi:hypothetical protein